MDVYIGVMQGVVGDLEVVELYGVCKSVSYMR